jgi:Tfp pilus assembly protein PilN
MQVDNRPESRRTSAQPATGQPEQDQPKPILRWPVALAVMVVALVILLGGGSLLVRQFTRPSSGPLGTVPASAATPAELATATPATTTAAAAAPPATQPAGAAAGGAATSVPTQQPTTAAATPVSTASAPSGAAAPNTNQQLEEEISAAYLRYWDVTGQAFWNLDSSHLDEVATGEELSSLQHDIEQLKVENRAIKSEVQHQYVVQRIQGDQADVRERSTDFSIYVDPVTKQPLPGQVRPDADHAPLNTTVYHLLKENGTWKVAKGDPVAND